MIIRTLKEIVNLKKEKMNDMKGIMKGINYVTDDKNRKIAIQIDLKNTGSCGRFL